MADHDMPSRVESEISSDKITVLPGATADMSAATYCIMREDHTLGNLLRWMIMKNEAVEFCGYSAPHPSEQKIHLRIQMYDGKSSLVALHEALDNLEAMTEAISEEYNKSLAAGDYDRPVELPIDFDSVNDRLWAQKEAEGRGNRAEFEQAKSDKLAAEEEKAKPKKGKGKTAKKET